MADTPDWPFRCDMGLEQRSVTISSISTIGDLGLSTADDVLAGGSVIAPFVEVAFRFGSGLEPLGRAGRFERRSVRNSAVHCLCDSCDTPAVGTDEEAKNFKGEERKGRLAGKVGG